MLNRVRRLDVTRGDPLWHRIDRSTWRRSGTRPAVPTSGLFAAGPTRGWWPEYHGGLGSARRVRRTAGPMLFLQGIADPIVPVSMSRKVYARVPWPKSFLMLRHDSHGTYLRPGGPGYRRMNAAVVDFLRWTLRGDQGARRLLPAGFGG